MPGINPNVVIGIFQSKLFQFLYDTLIQGGQRIIPQVKAVYLNELPFPRIGKHDTELKNLAHQLIVLNNERITTKLESKIIQIQNQIDYTEEKLNKIIYQLYELTSDEVKTIET